MKPVSSLTAGELSKAAKDALQALAIKPMRRKTGGWVGNGRRATLGVCDQLKMRGLARVEIEHGKHQLVITGAGKMLADVLDQRRQGA